MASESGDRGGLLSAGGILSIVVGAFELIGGGLVAAFLALGLGLPLVHPGLPFVAPWLGGEVLPRAGMVTIVAIVIAVLGIVAIIGGISALRRQSFGLALAGSICAFLLPFNIMGLLALIFVCLAKGEFGEGAEAEY
ncbi:MAG: hypothetical protein U9Q17_01380 [Chloroflexota bacterium]|nr:hypothetical protein [Chloroflexota bacterium]